MNKSLLTLGIILSLGTVGCAGFGIQSSSSLTSSYRAERGVDDLWSEGPSTPSSGVEPRHYADQSLGTLWETPSQETSGELGSTTATPRTGDLWNSATVTYTWAPSDDDRTTKSGRALGSGPQPTRY